jgi:two-component system sensor histidine kinase KdpD
LPALEDSRPNPDSLLALVKKQSEEKQRGKLKIFFGSSAGVGKTYSMLKSAYEKLQEGVDVVVGIAETHDRPETKKLLDILPALPLLEIDHKNIKIKEFDLEGALKRKPELILVDELAHTNAPNLRHAKRWSDIEDLLRAGIDVYTCLNVQHLESVNDVVKSITGIKVLETVPDSFFDQADEIVLIDIPSEELLFRLKEGKVYVANIAKNRAAENRVCEIAACDCSI